MKSLNTHTLSFMRWAILTGLLLTVIAGLYFFGAAAKPQAADKPVEEVLVNGRLAATRRRSGLGISESFLFTSNPDGSGGGGVSVASSIQLPGQPTWSPDGTKIAFSGVEPQFADIYVSNGDGSGTSTNLTNTATANETSPTWSVTGKIAYMRGNEVWTMNADGTGQARFAAITRAAEDPDWSPDGAKLAFSSGGDIWVINADGTNEHVVTVNTSTDSQPEWSPDGSKIAFRKGGAGISVINADGTNEAPITTNVSDQQPAWSPDGTKMAFTRDGIYVMDANGANQVRIFADVIVFPTPCCDTTYASPAWQPVVQPPNTFTISGRVTYNGVSVPGAIVNLSGTTNASATTDASGNYQFGNLPSGGNYTVSPSAVARYFTPTNRTFNNLNSTQTANFEVRAVCSSGKCVKNGKIAFERSGDIYVINADATGQTNITNNAANDIEPNWSPDGIRLAFATNRDGNYEIYRMGSELDPNPTRLTNNAAADHTPYYSPDGASIVFTSNRDGNNEIYKMNADGSDQLRLTNNTTSEFHPAFSPDGRKIVYLTIAPNSPIRIFTMNADGSEQQELSTTGMVGSFYNRPSYSPDGKKVIMEYGFDVFQRTTWTMNSDGTNRVQFPLFGVYPTYSPDGSQVAYACCFFDSSNRLRTANANGTTERIFPATTQPGGWPDWQGFTVPRAPFDFDGDGRSDVGFFRPSNSAWYLLQSTAGQWVPVWGLATDVLTPADYDGDMKTDVAVWRPSDGNFYVLNSFDATVRIENFGLPGDIPTGGDFDGDGKADVAVYRGGAQSVFYYRASMGNPQRNITFVPWGVSGDKAVVGDYDGDGISDAAVYRPSNGVWYIRQSSNGQLGAAHFGIADDVLIPADYDGDSKTDIAVFRGGVWYLLQSSQGFAAFQFGIPNDIPSPADYDGDGRADVAIFRSGDWWMKKSQSGAVEVVNYGASGDKPVPSAFVR